MAKNSRADETVLNHATSKKSSLRTTVPAFIVDSLSLGHGDIFRWKVNGNRLTVEIKKIRDKGR
jgi:hypothetical protein